jgi:hypothetical protein
MRIIARKAESYQKLTFTKGETPKRAKPFPKGMSRNQAGRRILGGEEELPQAIADTASAGSGIRKLAGK